MKVVFPTCCGVDIHKFTDWLLEHNCPDICMESPGIHPIFSIPHPPSSFNLHPTPRAHPLDFDLSRA